VEHRPEGVSVHTARARSIIGKLHAEECAFASAGVEREPEEVGDSSVRGGVDGVEQPREFLGRHEPLAFLLGEGLHAPGGVCPGEVEVSRRDLVQSVDQGSPAVCHVRAVLAADPTVPLHHVDPADGRKTPVFPPGRVGVERLLHLLPGAATGLPVVLERVLEQLAESRVLRVPLAALAALGHSAAAANRSPARSAGGSLTVWHPQPEQAQPTSAPRSTPGSIQSSTCVRVGSGLSGSFPSHNSSLLQADGNR